MYFDEGAWVALGFAIFVILVWKKAGSALREMLDARADKIRTELSEAEALRKEAKAQLDSLAGHPDSNLQLFRPQEAASV